MSLNIKKIFATTLLMGLTSQPAFSWNARHVGDAPIRWHSDTNTVGFKIQQSSIPVGSAARSAIMEAISTLNQNPSKIRARVNPDTEWVSVSNGQNEVWFTDNPLVLDGAPALCISHFNPFSFGVWYMTEADVIFNVAEAYTASRSMFDLIPYNGSLRPLQTTAMHEFGHAMGLQHENRIYNIMGTDWDHVNLNATTVTVSRGPDMGEGLITMYGGKTDPETVDLAVSNYKYLGTSEEYSAHQRTEVKAAISGETVDVTMAPPEDAVDPNQMIVGVRPGQVITVEFTFENNGLTNRGSIPVRYVLSTNRTITTFDRALANISYSFPRNRPMTRTMIVRIPNDVRVGSRLYLGVIADATSSVAELNKRNNTSYIALDIQ